MNHRIILIGGRGSGKSTVGPLLAHALHWTFVDADAVLETDAGRSIAEIFKSDGEPAFRTLETATFKKLLQQDSIVIATGGGIVTRPENVALLEPEYVVWLKVEPALAYARIQSDPTTAARRPALTAFSGLDELTALLAAREPLYQRVATHTVDAAQDAPSLAEAISLQWRFQSSTS